MTIITAVNDFWLNEVGPDRWFTTDAAVDHAIAERFRGTFEQAAGGVLDCWRGEPKGCLALLILLDQFPRNLFRGSSRAFATDDKARSIARQALARGLDDEVTGAARQFLYMPFQHSENLTDQRFCVRLAEERLPGSTFVEFALRHHDVIHRFGRFPHRNRALGRLSTAAEEAYLEQPDAGF
jgi:uncharacterized protein (DUF924 family)